ncbi:MAG: lipopolysaccharide assembly protein LapA domain-containing protein [Paracoccaceae bacterium]|jgi:uncharacterized integral membrane protein|tara:strand:- start:1009 stop:1341 length:333 start_codon:yes stop_codon:yes gene_type:complete
MKLGRYTTIVILLSLFILFAIANDEIVTINFPEVLSLNIEKSIYLPLYLLISSVLFVGIIIGVIIENLRNIRFRRDFNEKNKKLLKVERELKKTKEKFLTEEEKIFNLLD